MEKKYQLIEITSLRGIAACCVFFAHFNPIALNNKDGLFVFYFQKIIDRSCLGNLAVVFFFSLSAFLLARLAKQEVLKTNNFQKSKFFLRRCLRVLPLYFFITCIVYLIYSPILFTNSVFNSSELLWKFICSHFYLYLFFVSNWSLALININNYSDCSPGPLRILWTIGVEMQFYIIFCLCIKKLLQKKRLMIIFVILSCCLGLLFRICFTQVPIEQGMTESLGGLYYSSFAYTEVFVFGAIAGILSLRKENKFDNHFLKKIIGPCLLILIFACGFLWRDNIWYPYNWKTPLFYPILALIFALFIYWVSRNKQSLICILLRAKPLQILGKLSYGIYMWHLIAFSLALNILISYKNLYATDISIFIFFALSALIVLALAGASYILLEKPFLKIKKNIA